MRNLENLDPLREVLEEIRRLCRHCYQTTGLGALTVASERVGKDFDIQKVTIRNSTSHVYHFSVTFAGYRWEEITSEPEPDNTFERLLFRIEEDLVDTWISTGFGVLTIESSHSKKWKIEAEISLNGVVICRMEILKTDVSRAA